MSPAGPPQRHEVKKYANRRFYDVSRSRHVTLSDLYQLVREGHEIVVTDSASGEDITNVVLTQIILEHDPPKMDLFPSSLLHQAIQTNEQMIRRFIDRYFAQAMDAFVRSQRQFDEFLRRSGFSALSPTAPFDWVRMLFPGRTAPSAPSTEGPRPAVEPSESPAGEGDAVRALREQLTRLSREMDQLRAASRAGRKKPSKTGKKSAEKTKWTRPAAKRRRKRP